MTQTKKPVPSKVQDLWGLLQNAAEQSTSQWTVVKEERISLEAKRNIKTCQVLRGQGNPYARITWKDGKFNNLPLDWHCQQVVEVGDYLSISSLKLLTKVNQETGEELTCLYGRV